MNAPGQPHPRGLALSRQLRFWTLVTAVGALCNALAAPLPEAVPVLLGGIAPAVLSKRMRWPWVLASAVVVSSPLISTPWAAFALLHGLVLALAAARPSIALQLRWVLTASLLPCALLLAFPSPFNAPGWLLGVFNLMVGVVVTELAAHQLRAFSQTRADLATRSLAEQIASSAVATLWPALAVALLAVLALGWRFELARRSAALQLRAEQAASLVLDHLGEHRRAVSQVAADVRLPRRPPVLEGLRQTRDGFLTLLVTDASGEIIDFRAPGTPPALRSVEDRSYFQQPRKTGSSYVSPVFIGRGFGTDVLVAVSAPYFDEEQGFAGVVQGSLSLAVLGQRLHRIASQHGLQLVLIDDARIVVHSTLDELVALDPAQSPLLEPGPDAQGFRLNRLELHGVRAIELPELGWTLVLLEPLRPLAAVQSASFALTGCLVLLGLVVLGWRSRRFAEPFARPLRDMVSRIREIDLTVPDSLKPLRLKAASAEFSELTADFNAMLQRLHDLGEELRCALDAQARLNRVLEERVEQRTADLTAALAQAERLAEAKTRFLSHMSHELRTPLTAILGFAEQALLSPGDAQRNVQALEVVVRNGRHLLGIVNDVLDAARMDAGQLAVVLEPLAPLVLVEDVHALLAPEARQRGIALDLHCHWPLPALVDSDPLRLRQVLINLVGNALKFTEAGRVSIVLEAEQGRLVIAIHDTGIGIHTEQLGRLFNPFEQADASVTRRFGGSGLGLFISKRLVEAMGGDLAAESTPGQGSCFRIRLPLDDAAHWISSHPGRSESPTEALPIPRLKGRVLVVDDVEDLRELISQTVRATGVECETASNGAEAVDKAMATHFDLVLLDKHMPVLDGRAAMRRLRESSFPGALVALSADVLDEGPAQDEAFSFDAELAKPVNRAALYATLQRFLPQETAVTESDPARAVQAAFAEIRERFRMRLRDEAELLLRALETGDVEDLGMRLHTLKGSAGTFGFAQLSALAAEAESRLKGNSANDLPEGLLTALLDAIRATVSGTAGG